MKKKFLSVLLVLLLVASFSLVTAVPVAAVGESTFTVTDGTYTTVKVNDENGTISATLTGEWGESAVIGDFTATGEGGLYVVMEEPRWGTTATIDVSGTLSENEITFSGTGVWISGDPITDDEVTITGGTVIIQPDGSFVVDVDLTGDIAGGYTVEINIIGSISMVTESRLTKANILKDSGVPGKGLENAPGQQKPFNPNSKAGEHAGKKK